MTSKQPSSIMKTKCPIDNMDTSSLSSFSKWVPLICAGAAIGVSVLALKEIKNVRKELNLKLNTPSSNADVSQKIEQMDAQLKKITSYLTKHPKVKSEKEIIKTKIVPETIKIINEPAPEEYEEVEVTDDEN